MIDTLIDKNKKSPEKNQPHAVKENPKNQATGSQKIPRTSLYETDFNDIDESFDEKRGKSQASSQHSNKNQNSN